MFNNHPPLSTLFEFFRSFRQRLADSLTHRRFSIGRLLAIGTALLVVKTIGGVVWEYRRYFPPDFTADFLAGRESHFFTWYRWAFYVHLVSGPPSLAAGLFLLSDAARRFAPLWHRRVGRLQVANIFLLLVPSGLAMAYHAASGPSAGVGLALLAIALFVTTLCGWRSAVARRFAEHRVWMQRTFVLLFSAVVIRILGGTAIMFELDSPHVYTISVWVSWLGPLAVLEIIRSLRGRHAPS